MIAELNNFFSKERKTSLFQYFVLLTILSLGFLSFVLSIGNRRLQFKIVVLTSFLYVVLGIIHHFFEKTLYPKIVVEYIVVALLAVVILGGLLFL